MLRMFHDDSKRHQPPVARFGNVLCTPQTQPLHWSTLSLDVTSVQEPAGGNGVLELYAKDCQFGQDGGSESEWRAFGARVKYIVLVLFLVKITCDDPKGRI